MIYNMEKVHIMDVNERDASILRLSDMFGKYIVNGIEIENGTIHIDFKFANQIVKITDWKGWSDIIAIDRNFASEWITIATLHGKEIMITPDTLIPVYNPDIVSHGFHGETKYAHKVIPASEVKLGNVLRVRHAKDDNQIDIDFDVVTECKPFKTEKSIGYSITTVSEFFNCSDIYLFGGSYMSSKITNVIDLSSDNTKGDIL